ncbi:MAG: MerR family transcriptional regulator [Hydrogenophilus sp.]|nr:MerR family transcriptional regulator [Hydrogenophilus sp.]
MEKRQEEAIAHIEREWEWRPVPAKRYFTVQETAELVGVPVFVIRSWEEEFAPFFRRRGRHRRFYLRQEVLVLRRICRLFLAEGADVPEVLLRLDDGARVAAASRVAVARWRTALRELQALLNGV